MKSGVLLLAGGIEGATTGGAATGAETGGAPSGKRPTSGRRAAAAGAGAAAAASALRSMMPESSRSRAVVALGATDGELPTLAVSALSEKSIEFSSRCPVAPGPADAPSDAEAAGRAAAPLLYDAALVATSSAGLALKRSCAARPVSRFAAARCSCAAGAATATGAAAAGGEDADTAATGGAFSAVTIASTCPMGIQSLIPSAQTYVSAFTTDVLYAATSSASDMLRWSPSVTLTRYEGPPSPDEPVETLSGSATAAPLVVTPPL